ncbi:MAG: flagellar hook-length control protein FliK [Alphaproteobacteria bacterium]|nr:flagellar hook-length control protein FliK [Alphaproteobacteria bacterium]
MNVKETNNSLVQMLFNKIAGNAQVGVEGAEASKFANMIADNVVASDSLIRNRVEVASKMVGEDVAVKERVAIESSSKGKEAVARKKDRAECSQKDAEATKDKPVKNVKKKNREDVVGVAAVENVSKTEDVVVVDAVAEDREGFVADSDEKSVVQVIEGAEMQTKDLSAVVAMGVDMQQMVAVMNGEGMILLSPNMDMAALSSMPEIPVVNQFGEVVTMSSEEFVAKMQEASATSQLYVAAEPIVDEMVAVLPAEVLAETGEYFVQDEVVFGDEVVNNTVVAEEASIAIVDEQTVEQARILDSKLKDGQKIRVDVNVEEENFAYTDEVELLQDKEIVDDAIKSVFKDSDNVASETKVSAYKSFSGVQPQQVQAAVQGNVSGVAATIAPTVDNAAYVGAESVKVATSENIITTNPVSATGATAMSQGLKPEIIAKAEETSLRDVYKGMGRDAVEQVKVNIIKSAVKGVDKIEIQLKPEDLGRVHIKMQISKDGKLQADIIASRQETLDILQKEAETLQKAFNEAGFDTDNSSFSFSFRGEEEQKQNSELRNFIGNVLEQEANEEVVSNDNQIWDPVQGLNIRV